MSMRYPGGLIATSPVNARYPSGVWTQAQAAPYQAQNVWTRDQFWPNTTLLLQGDGAVNGAQNNTFLDSSSNNFTITRNGNTTQGSFTPYEQDGYWSNYFGGSSSDYIAIADNAALDFGTGDFTIEFWFNFAVSQDRAIATGWTTSGVVSGWAVDASNTGVSFTSAVNDSYVTATQSGSILNGVWNHFAAVRSGSTVTVYLNGVGGTPVTNTQSINTQSSGMMIGRSIYNPNPRPYQGYVSNFRILKGTALYSSNFTPSAAPLTAITNTSLLTCQSNRFKDNSTNNFTVTPNGASSVQSFQPFPGATTWSASVLGGSAYFDGSGDYLTAPGGSAPTGSGAWTIEFWYYFTASQSDSRILGGGQNTLNLGISSNGGLFYGKSNVGNVFGGSPLPPGINFWTHVVIGKNGSSTYRIWVNGVSQSTGTDSYSYDSGTNFIGGSSSLSFFFTGYLANLRVTNTDVYGVSNTTITVPTSPLTAVSGTQFLMSTTNAGIYDNSMMNNLETVGNAQVSTSVVKYGTGSMAFDGTGDYLLVPSNPNIQFGTGSFTIEGWVYSNSISTPQVVLARRAALNAQGITIVIDPSALAFAAGDSNTSAWEVTFTSSTLASNTWYHFAFVRDGSSWRAFVNGVQIGTTTTWAGAIADETSTMVIGANSNFANGLNGYIDDLRITKGAARYITNFTPPIARLPAQ